MANLRYENMFYIELAHDQYPQQNRSPFQLEASLPCQKLLKDYKLSLHQSTSGFSVAAPVIGDETPYAFQFPFLSGKVKLSFILFAREPDFYETYSLPFETPGTYVYYLHNLDATQINSQFLINHDSLGADLRVRLSGKIVTGEVIGEQVPQVFDVSGDEVSLTQRIIVNDGFYRLDLQHLVDGVYTVTDGNGERTLYLTRASLIRRAPVAIIDIYLHQAVDPELQAVSYVPFIDEAGTEQFRQIIQHQEFAVHFGPFHHAPFYTARYLEFTDADPDAGYVQGEVLIGMAENERTVSHYALYWGTDDGQRLSGEPIIVLLTATGNDLTFVFPSGTPLPYGATHLLAYTQCRGVEMLTGLSIPVTELLPDQLVLWLDANDPWHRQETNGYISQWDDKSRHAHHAQQIASSSRPASGIDSQNGRNLISFDGVDDYLSIASLAFMATNAYSIVCVLKTKNLQHDVSILSFNTIGGDRSGQYIVKKSGQIEVEFEGYGNTHVLAGPGTWCDHRFALLSILNDGSSLRLFHNMQLHNTVNVTLQAANQFHIGKGVHGHHDNHGNYGHGSYGNYGGYSNHGSHNSHHSHFYDGSIGEIFIYARYLPDSERQALELRLMERWGISA